MTEPDSSPSSGAGRGAQRRAAARDAQARREALAWWRRPGVIVFLGALILAAVGWGLVIREGRRVPVRQATVDGLQVRLDQARWILDQMDHGENFQKPSTMMPDMPEWGKQRVTLDLAFYNRSKEPQIYAGEEFFLVPEIGPEVPPMGAQVGRARIGPGQALNTAIHFDFDTSEPHGKLRVEWRRRGESVYLPIPEPAEHYHLRPRGGEVALPPDVRLLLPIAKAERGKRLFDGVYGCVACHGDPEIPGTNNVGPHLAGVATAAAARVDGLPAAQYLYQSIIDPNADIAPDCKNGPCTAPSAMPEYASLVNLQDVADLLGYLMSLGGEPVSPGPALGSELGASEPAGSTSRNPT